MGAERGGGETKEGDRAEGDLCCEGAICHTKKLCDKVPVT